MDITRRQALGTGIGGLAAAVGNAAMAQDAAKPGHVVLLGDSIFDNRVYVNPKPAVIDQLKKALPRAWKATLRAVDGDVAADVPAQLKKVPEDATHLVMSVGGNDALQASSIFGMQVNTGGEAFLEIAKIRKKFDADYRATLKAVLALGKPTAVCTIYDPNYAIAVQQQMSVCGLGVFNDCITRAAIREGLPLIDLRVLFTDPKDYANPIEPSDVGGAKIVREIVQIVTEHDFTIRRTAIYASAK